MKIKNKARVILFIAIATVLSVVKYYYADTGHTRHVTLEGIAIATSIFAFGYTIMMLLLFYISSNRKLTWKILVIMTFASIPAALSAWDWYGKEYAYGSHPVRDTILQFIILFFSITLLFSIFPLYTEYIKRKEKNDNQISN